MGGIGKKIFKNGAASLYGFALTIASQLCVVPVFIHAWGKFRYGEWLVLTSVPSYFALADVGFGQVASNKMTMLHAEKDSRGVTEVLHTMWLFQTVLGAVLLAAGAAIFLTLPWAAWLGLHAWTEPRAHRALLGLLVYVLINMQSQGYAAVYRAGEQFARSIAISNTGRLLELVVMLCLVAEGEPEITVIVGMIACRAGLLGFYQYDTRRRVKDLAVGFSAASRRQFAALIRPGVGHFGLGISQGFQLQGVTLVINKVLGAEAVTIFTVSRTLTRIPLQVMNLVNGAVYPEFGRVSTGANLEKAREIHRIMAQISFWAALPVAAAAVTFGPRAIHAWTLGQVEVGRLLLLVLNLSVIVNLLWNSSSIVLSSTNRHATLGSLYALLSIAALAATYFLTRWVGIVGPAFTLTAVETAMAIYVVPRSCRAVHDSMRAMLADVVTVSTFRKHLALYLKTAAKYGRGAIRP